MKKNIENLHELTNFFENSKNKIFTGVGSRSTPEHVAELMKKIGSRLRVMGWTLRSGAARGADAAFEKGFDDYENFAKKLFDEGRISSYDLSGKKEIYLPFRGFNGNTSELSGLKPESFDLARSVHPAWERCSDFAKKAHARNAYQVLGQDLDRPCDLLICWTKDGAVDEKSSINAGGTRTAIVMAERNNVPVLNLANGQTHKMFKRWFEDVLDLKCKPTLTFGEDEVQERPKNTQVEMDFDLAPKYKKKMV